MLHILLLMLAAFAGGALNAIAGGGSFLTFPALIFTGVPAVIANATNTVALFPGSFASAFSYRHGLAKLEGISLRTLVLVSIVGGALGAVILLKTPENTFLALTPWLLLFATVMFAASKRLGAELRKRVRFSFTTLLVTQFVIAIYGGYVGGGIGILMLAALAAFGMTDMTGMNGIKTILAGCLNGVAVVVFVAAGKVYWMQAVIMMVAAIAGGYAGAHYAQKLPGSVLRGIVICTGVAMSAYFFYQAYGRYLVK
jgi:uncharacterized membrane protein YfcA